MNEDETWLYRAESGAIDAAPDGDPGASDPDDAAAGDPPARRPRRLVIRLVRFGEVADQTQEGIREAFAPGAFDGVDPTQVVLESQRHDGPLAGVGESIEQDETEARIVMRLGSDDEADRLYQLAAPAPHGDGILTNASMVFRPLPGHSATRPDGVVVRSRVDLARVAVLDRGAYPSAGVIAARNAASAQGREGTNVDQDQLNAAVAQAMQPVVDRIAAIESGAGVPGGEAPELYRCANLSEYVRRAWSGELADDLLYRTIADQVTGNNAGVTPPAWLREVQGIVDPGRPVVQAFGGPRAMPESGMEIDWPKYSGSLAALVALQASQKSEVTSVRVDIEKGYGTLVTYAGGSDIAKQLLDRSSPSYREQYDRIMLMAWGLRTDYAFAAALQSAATGTLSYRHGYGAAKTLSTSAESDDIIDATSHGFSIGQPVTFLTKTGGTGLFVGVTYWVTADSFAANTFRIAAYPGGPSLDFTTDITAGTVAPLADTTGATLRQALFAASSLVRTATGAPAQAVLAAPDQFQLVAGMTGIVPPVPANNPSNASGTARADTLEVVVNGLAVTEAPGLDAGTILVGNRTAAAWYEDGPKVMTADNPTKLGQDVAWYSYNVPAIFTPSGLVIIRAA